MVVVVLRVTEEHRRARVARRHGLDSSHRALDVVSATTALTALHATEPTTPYLALHARVRGLTVADVDAALYAQRSLVKVMAMRRTLFVVTRALLPAVAGSCGRRVAEIERRRLAKQAAELVGHLGEDWMVHASEEIVATLTGRELSTRELRDELPHLGATFIASPGTKWSTAVSLMSRLLTILTASGVVVRGGNAGHWRVSRSPWTSMTSWLGEPMTPAAPEAGYAAMVRHWLWTFGPGTEADIVWWLGSTKAAARRALADIDAVGVELEDGSTGWVLPDDTADLEGPPDVGVWTALLPSLDPTTMGWQRRSFYLDPARTPYLFDSAGNAGTTVWVNGRIVGCWVQDDDQRVQLILMGDVPQHARRRLDNDVSLLDEFLAGEHVTNVFASAQMKHQPLG